MSQQQIAVIEQSLRKSDVQTMLIQNLGLAQDDEKGRLEASTFISSVMEQVKKTAGDKFGDLTTCNPDSIVRSMIDAARLRVHIDARQQAHLIKRGNQCQLQIGFRGYISKIAEYYKDADFTAEAIFEGDGLEIIDEGGYQTYKFTKANAFANNWDKLQGVLVRLSYTKGGERFQKITTVSKDDLIKIRAKAVTDAVWAQWPIEKSKAAAIKRASKIQFADVMGLQELIRYDNENNFDLSQQPAAPVRPSIIDNINSSLSPSVPDAQDDQSFESSGTHTASNQSSGGEIIDVEPEDAVIFHGREVAQNGVTAYVAWRDALSDKEKELVRPHNGEFSRIAKQADANSEEPTV